MNTIKHHQIMNDRVIHNFDKFKKYYPHLDLLAFESNTRIDERIAKRLEALNINLS